MPPDVALLVTLAVLPIEPDVTVYLYCKAVPTSVSEAVMVILIGVPSVAKDNLRYQQKISLEKHLYFSNFIQPEPL